MNIFQVIALLVTGALGVAGWFAAWRARGQAIETQTELTKAAVAIAAEKDATSEANAGRVAAEARSKIALERAVSMERELATERAARQALVDAIKKAGLPVGPVLVDNALDRLYQDTGGQGLAAGSGRGPLPAVPGISPAGPATAPKAG